MYVFFFFFFSFLKMVTRVGKNGKIRKLAVYYWSVTGDVEALLSSTGYSSITTYASNIRNQLRSPAFYTSVTTAIPTVTSVDDGTAIPNTRHPTSQPTQVPSPSPTEIPKKKSPSDDTNSAMMYLLVLLVIPLGLLVYVFYTFRKKIADFLGVGASDEKHDKEKIAAKIKHRKALKAQKEAKEAEKKAKIAEKAKQMKNNGGNQKRGRRTSLDDDVKIPNEEPEPEVEVDDEGPDTTAIKPATGNPIYMLL
jgi:hypothetical protein